jgi:peptide/nickel transport system substrate-binding protein
MPVYFGGGADDYSRDPDLIKLLEQAGSTMDAAARKVAYSAVIKRATEQAYWVPLHTYVTTYGLSRNLELKTYPDELPRFWLSKWK